MKFFFKRARGIDNERLTIALAGNPNVGKSTLFNTLTGMHRHTGNWAGKTVDNALGEAYYGGRVYNLADIPGTYSLLSHSEEERVARDYICFGSSDVVAVVCDATALSRSLILALEICEACERTLLVLNMSAEAEKCGIKIDTGALSRLLGIPVVVTEATKKSSRATLFSAIDNMENLPSGIEYSYPEIIERERRKLSEIIEKNGTSPHFARWAAITLIEGDSQMADEILNRFSPEERQKISNAALSIKEILYSEGYTDEKISDSVAETIVSLAESIADRVTVRGENKKEKRERTLDKIFTGRLLAFPIMALFVMLLFYLTLSLANYPSELLFSLFSYAEEGLLYILSPLPEWIYEPIVFGAFRTLGTVVSVMLVPMAIFFPLFTILEDSGYLPRIAYNLDRPFRCSGACGKQALTMCMGIGCNCVGVSGSAIIDSKRERLLAILTNSLMPCNGKLPMLITLIGVLLFVLFGIESAFVCALLLSGLLIIAVIMTFIATRVLSSTLLRGECSSFTIELPPYRRPRFLKVIGEALLFKVLLVLKRAVIVSLLAGLVIYILSVVEVGDNSLIRALADALAPVGRAFGLDGVILLAFILGLPANEIIIPIMLMIYMGLDTPLTIDSLELVRSVFIDNGWTLTTALSSSALALFHSPCSTTLFTVYKETKSLRYTLLSFLIPTVIGLSLCALINLASLFITLAL